MSESENLEASVNSTAESSLFEDDDLYGENSEWGASAARTSSVESSGSKGEQGGGQSVASRRVNTNPDWCKNLKANFKSLIINKCCQRTRQAVDNNEDIEV